MEARGASQVHDPDNCSVGNLLIRLDQDLSLSIFLGYLSKATPQIVYL